MLVSGAGVLAAGWVERRFRTWPSEQSTKRSGQLDLARDDDLLLKPLHGHRRACREHLFL